MFRTPNVPVLYLYVFLMWYKKPVFKICHFYKPDIQQAVSIHNMLACASPLSTPPLVSPTSSGHLGLVSLQFSCQLLLKKCLGKWSTLPSCFERDTLIPQSLLLPKILWHLRRAVLTWSMYAGLSRVQLMVTLVFSHALLRLLWVYTHFTSLHLKNIGLVIPGDLRLCRMWRRKWTSRANSSLGRVEISLWSWWGRNENK